MSANSSASTSHFKGAHHDSEILHFGETWPIQARPVRDSAGDVRGVSLSDGAGATAGFRVVQEVRPGVQRKDRPHLPGIRGVVSGSTKTETGHAQCLHHLSR